MKRHLTDCTTAIERLEWLTHQLHCGHTVTEAGLALGGVPAPIALITGLRATGIEIETITVDRVDHAGDRHTGCTAWRLMTSPMGREAAALARRQPAALARGVASPACDQGFEAGANT